MQISRKKCCACKIPTLKSAPSDAMKSAFMGIAGAACNEPVDGGFLLKLGTTWNDPGVSVRELFLLGGTSLSLPSAEVLSRELLAAAPPLNVDSVLA